VTGSHRGAADYISQPADVASCGRTSTQSHSLAGSYLMSADGLPVGIAACGRIPRCSAGRRRRPTAFAPRKTARPSSVARVVPSDGVPPV